MATANDSAATRWSSGVADDSSHPLKQCRTAGFSPICPSKAHAQETLTSSCSLADDAKRLESTKNSRVVSRRLGEPCGSPGPDAARLIALQKVQQPPAHLRFFGRNVRKSPSRRRISPVRHRPFQQSGPGGSWRYPCPWLLPSTRKQPRLAQTYLRPSRGFCEAELATRPAWPRSAQARARGTPATPCSGSRLQGSGKHSCTTCRAPSRRSAAFTHLTGRRRSPTLTSISAAALVLKSSGSAP